MVFMSWIIQRLSNASGFFYTIYLEVNSWIFPFWQAATFFYQLSLIFNQLRWDFYDFSIWVNSVVLRLQDILSWTTIQGYITNWLYYLYDLRQVFYYFWQNVTDVIIDWWSDAQSVVQGWIEVAKAFLQSQLNTILSWLTNLQAAWDSFSGKIPSIDVILSWFMDWWGYVLANIISWGALTATQIENLIDSWFRDFTPFWEGWIDVKSDVIAFITDPLSWLEDKFTNWFLGGE